MADPIATLKQHYRGLVSKLPEKGTNKFRLTIVSFGEDPGLRTILGAVAAQGDAAKVAVYSGDPNEDLEEAAAIANRAAGRTWINPFDNDLITTYAHPGPDVFAAVPALSELLAHLSTHYATLDQVRALIP